VTVDFEDLNRMHRHDHTVDMWVFLARGGKHYVDENGVFQQTARTKWRASSNQHDTALPISILLLVQGH